MTGTVTNPGITYKFQPKTPNTMATKKKAVKAAKTKKVTRSAATGKFVTKQFAKQNPTTTFTDKIK